jgi:hypothetical protein
MVQVKEAAPPEQLKKLLDLEMWLNGEANVKAFEKFGCGIRVHLDSSRQHDPRRSRSDPGWRDALLGKKQDKVVDNRSSPDDFSVLTDFIERK